MKLKNASGAKGVTTSRRRSLFHNLKSPNKNNGQHVNGRTRVVCGTTLLICAFAVVVGVFAEQQMRPPTKVSLVGNWIGYDQDRLFFCRLELEEKGKGFFAKAYVDHPAVLYTVESWSLDAFELKISLLPVDRDAYPIYLKGSAGFSQLTLEMGEANSRWRRELTLFNERMLKAKSGRTLERIDKYKKEQKAKSDK